MDVWDAIHWIRFRGFLHIPDDEKRRVCRQLMGLRHDRIHVRTMVHHALQTNRLSDVQTCVRLLQRRSDSVIPREIRNRMDLEVFLEMYWDETHELYSILLLKGVLALVLSMGYGNSKSWSPWPMVHRLWTTAKSQEDKGALLIFLEAFQDADSDEDVYELYLDPST